MTKGPKIKPWLTIWALLCTMSSARAEQKSVVLNLPLEESQKGAIRTSLASELRAQSMLLVQAEKAGALSPQEGPNLVLTGKGDNGSQQADLSSESEKAFAEQALQNKNTVAVLWLQVDRAASVTWLRVMTQNNDTVRQTPLPYPPSTIEPRLFSIAATSLLEQVLEEDSASKSPSKTFRAIGDAPVHVTVAPAPSASTIKEEKPAPLSAISSKSLVKSRPEEHAPRFILRIGYSLGLSRITAGMRTDGAPPSSVKVYDDEGHFITTGWVPDNDSRDSSYKDSTRSVAEANFTRECPADGKVTRYPELPSSYCARIGNAGFYPTHAVRSEIGYWILPRLALAAVVRLQFDAGQGTLSNLLLGARAEYLLSPPQSNFNYSVYTGATVGQIQPRPTALFEGQPSPYIRSGLMAVHAGAAVGWWFNRYLGFRLAPEINVFFPETLIHLDITAAAETRF